VAAEEAIGLTQPGISMMRPLVWAGTCTHIGAPETVIVKNTVVYQAFLVTYIVEKAASSLFPTSPQQPLSIGGQRIGIRL
jgi:hypothetical protein